MERTGPGVLSSACSAIQLLVPVHIPVSLVVSIGIIKGPFGDGVVAEGHIQPETVIALPGKFCLDLRDQGFGLLRGAVAADHGKLVPAQPQGVLLDLEIPGAVIPRHFADVFDPLTGGQDLPVLLIIKAAPSRFSGRSVSAAVTRFYVFFRFVTLQN